MTTRAGRRPTPSSRPTAGSWPSRSPRSVTRQVPVAASCCTGSAQLAKASATAALKITPPWVRGGELSAPSIGGEAGYGGVQRRRGEGAQADVAERLADRLVAPAQRLDHRRLGDGSVQSGAGLGLPDRLEHFDDAHVLGWARE